MWRLARKPAFAAVGVLVAAPTLAAFGVYVWLFVRSMIRHHWALEHLIALLYLWQTQTGAAFALAAAGLGAIVILHQTGSTRRLEEMRRERREAALRAMLPLDLMELINYASTCARMFARYVVRGKTLAVEAILTSPPLPDMAARVSELIEASDPDHARPLIVLVKRMQIQHARAAQARSHAAKRPRSTLLWETVADGVIDAAEIYARCSKLFIYSRGVVKTATPITAADVKEALLLMSLGLSETDELEKRIEHRARVGELGSRWPEP